MYKRRTQKEMIIEFWSQVEKRSPNACWLWSGRVATDGYGRFYNKGKELIVHRLAYALDNKVELTRKVVILQSCKNKICCNPKHLYLETKKQQLERMAEDGRLKGFAQRGEKNKNAKLTNEQASQIKEIYFNEHISQSALAKRFKISAHEISALIRKIWWKWLK